MTSRRKPTVRWMADSRTLHIETSNGIINIKGDLTDDKGRNVDSVEIRGDDYPGEQPVSVKCKSKGNYGHCRLIKAKTKRRKH